MSNSRRALIVGIDDYPTQPLRGCVNDANAISELLKQDHDGAPNFDVQLVTTPSTTITRAILTDKIQKLFKHDKADVALLYFSGHGTENDLGGYLVTPDAKKYNEGVSLTDVLTLANDSKATERIIILDSCMSGWLGEVPATGGANSNLREGVSILTASRSNQVSIESGGRGVFTELVCAALEGGAADVLGEVTAASIYTYVEQALGPWEQRPLFKAHLSQMAPIRVAQPAVERPTLRLLTTWFPAPNDEFPLDKSYEDTEPGFNPDHVQVFKKLQKCRDAKLIEAVDAEFLYFAAMNNKSCRLTALGKRYWQLAKENRI
ncbi:caspase family protein [Rhodococcus erythropolis]|uniref:caspase family protein n=1 Tax=Rhodococcus erythropolis TaxID=1833 RepID=UPI000767B92A|nr:caspase family protein [Rhodococcus erythropolis]MBO8150150.1 caspase family protein [Rhodococcus erythropolis]MDO1492400.1 caspase family protein [Rhodococcus erythropolis]GCB57236.1 hypothetical protein rerp_36440 [Rhodococcus erythropolis]